MAYDPNDPADVAIVTAAVEDALTAERETHQAEVTRLTGKNTELLGKLTRARAGNGDGGNTEEITRLEREVEETGAKLRTAESDLRTAQRELRTITTERDTLRTTAEQEAAFSRNMLIENALTSALVEANVAPHFMEAAKAMHAKAVKVEVNGEERTVTANGKSVADFVKEWAASDAGKHYVSAPANGGGGANNAGANGGGTKKLTEMNEGDRLKMAKEDPVGWAALLAAEGPKSDAIAA
jgi:hypothetical protein